MERRKRDKNKEKKKKVGALECAFLKHSCPWRVGVPGVGGCAIRHNRPQVLAHFAFDKRSHGRCLHFGLDCVLNHGFDFFVSDEIADTKHSWFNAQSLQFDLFAIWTTYGRILSMAQYIRIYLERRQHPRFFERAK